MHTSLTREVIVDAQTIHQRVVQLGQAISRDYADGNLVVIGVLKGSFIFMADLIRAIDIPIRVDFIGVSSYGNTTVSSGEIVLKNAPSLAVRDQDVLLVEDIVDSGLTVQWLRDYFSSQEARSIKVCALIDKAERRTQSVQIDYCGFAIPKGFLVGYGLDFNEEYRHLSAIYHLSPPL
jgi:hypoxanthine phosphoribosyltransferase